MTKHIGTSTQTHKEKTESPGARHVVEPAAMTQTFGPAGDTLEEAIKHALTQAKELQGSACGDDHTRLAGWLIELVARQRAEQCTYQIRWSEKESRFTGTCFEFPLLQSYAPSGLEAWQILHRSVREAIKTKLTFFTAPFKTTSDQTQVLPDIIHKMTQEGMSPHFIKRVMKWVIVDQGLYDLLAMWYSEESILDRKDILEDIERTLDDLDEREL
jgi:hypothetical protein